MTASPTVVSIAIGEQQDWQIDSIQCAATLTSACAALEELSQTWSSNAFEGREALQLFRRTTACPDTPHQAAVHETAWRALVQYGDGDPAAWEMEHIERALIGLQQEVVRLRECDLEKVPIEFLDVRESQAELLHVLELQKRLDAVTAAQQGTSDAEQAQAWITAVSPSGRIRQEGLSWLARERGAEGRESLWERLCDVLCAHEKREYFADNAEQRLQQYMGFGRRLVALWEAYREIEPATASEFMATEELAELLAGTCHTGWETRLAHLETMLQLARQARGLRACLPRAANGSLFLLGTEVGAQWRRQVLRDHVLHQVAQTFSLYDEQTGALDVHVFPSLLQTCNEALALGLAPWDREEIWVEQFQELLLEEGEPGYDLSQWFWGERDGDSAQCGLFGVLEDAFMATSSEARGQLFDFLLDWYQKDRRDGDALEIPSAELVILRQIEQALERALEEESPLKMMRALTALAKQVGRPFFEQPRDRAWRQLMHACEGESHLSLVSRLRILRHQHTGWDPRQVVEALTRVDLEQEPAASAILESMHEPSIARALSVWQRSTDREVWEEFQEKELPRAATAALRSLPDLVVHEQMSSLRNLLVEAHPLPDGGEQLKITPFGLRSWAALLKLLRFQPEEGSPSYVGRLTQWMNQAAHREDHPHNVLALEQERLVLRWVREDGLRLEHVPDSFQRQIQVVLAAVSQNGLALQFAKGACRRHRGIALGAVMENPEALEWVSHPLRTDRDLVQAAIRQNGLALRFARYPALQDKAIVLEAVRQNGLALQYAPEHLREDPEVIQAAIEQNRDAGAFALPPPVCADGPGL